MMVGILNLVQRRAEKRLRQDTGPHLPQPSSPPCAKSAALLHPFPNGFATIEVKENIELRSQAESRAPNAIRFRFERFRRAKNGLLDSFYLPNCALIHIVFTN
jgi:hypothetical protein